VRRRNGRCTISSTFGKRSVAATRKRSAIATFRSRSSGSPSFFSSQTPKSVNAVKLTISPAMIANGLRRLPVAPPAKMIGRTGSTHGEIAVMKPAARPMPISTSIQASG
jgi:hypothetical protein